MGTEVADLRDGGRLKDIRAFIDGTAATSRPTHAAK